MLNINNQHPRSGRIIGEDGKTYNYVDLLRDLGATATPVNTKEININTLSAETGRIIAEDNKIYNEVDLLKTINIGNPDFMEKSVYDTNNNGIVDDSEKLNGQLPSYYATSEELNSVKLLQKNDVNRISVLERNYNSGTLVEIFNNITQWVVQPNGQQSIDPILRKLKVTSTGVPSATRKVESLFLGNTKVLKIRVYVPNITNLLRFSIYLSNDLTYTNFLFYAINGYACVEGWNEFVIDTSKFSVTGTGSFNNDIVSMQVRVEAQPATATEVIFDSLIRDTKQKPQVILSFDDGWDSQYNEGFRRMHKKGFIGSIAVVPTLVNTPSYMTLNQLHEVYDYGWELTNHTYNHVNLRNVDAATVRSEIQLCENWLNTNGFTKSSNIVVYPQGGYNDNVILEMQSRRAGRSIIEALEPGIPNDKYKIKVHNVLNTVTPTTVYGWIDEAINTGGTLLLLWHILSTPADTSTKYTPDNFQLIIDYIYSKRDQIEVVTLQKYLDRCNL